MSRVNVRQPARILLCCGSSGSGKSEHVKRLLAKTSRALVWDTEDEYSERGWTRVTTLRGLIDATRGVTRARVAYVARSARFGDWARVALAWGHCTAVAEEIASVTGPGKAPDGWGDLVRRGRKYTVRVIGITQRPAESDKTIVANATTIRCGALHRARDAAYMAAEMGIDAERITRLEPLEWLQLQRSPRKITEGRLKFP